MSKMCPLNYNRAKKDVSACMGDGCAWWNPISEQCSIVTIAEGIVYMLGKVSESEVSDDDNNPMEEREISAPES